MSPLRRRKLAAGLAMTLYVPLYAAAVVTLINSIDRPPYLLEVVLYGVLGIIWIFPLRALFKWVGRAGPE